MFMLADSKGALSLYSCFIACGLFDTNCHALLEATVLFWEIVKQANGENITTHEQHLEKCEKTQAITETP